MNTYTYFLRETDSRDRIKIGKSVNPTDRISDIQAGNPRKLVVVAVVPDQKVGPSELTINESWFHEHFSAERLAHNSEWFLASGRLRRAVLYLRKSPALEDPTRFSEFIEVVEGSCSREYLLRALERLMQFETEGWTP